MTQNTINSPTSSSGWTSFTTIIDCNPTAPTPGTIVQNVSYYLQFGNILYISYTFAQSTAGTAGSGPAYLFNMPTGFTINTTIAPIYITQYNTSHIGTCWGAFNPGGWVFTGVAVPANTNLYCLMASVANSGSTVGATSGTLVGPANCTLNNTSLSYTVKLAVPIN